MTLPARVLAVSRHGETTLTTKVMAHGNPHGVEVSPLETSNDPAPRTPSEAPNTTEVSAATEPSSRVPLARSLTLAGGVLILAASIVPVAMMTLMTTGSVAPAGMPDMPMSMWPWMGVLALLWGATAGALVLWGSSRIRRADSPEELRAGGVVALVASALSLVTMGGFLLGALLGMAGGILAITEDADPPGRS